MELNVAACLWLTQAAAPHLEATKGSIVNISSIAAKRAFAGATLYCISKAAVDHLTCCTALELAPKVPHPQASLLLRLGHGHPHVVLLQASMECSCASGP
jgi:hypothetical protein